jgi:hypothetical protein
LNNLIDTKLYDTLLNNQGIVLDNEGHVVKFLVYKDDWLLQRGERIKLTFDIKDLKSLQNLTVISLNNTDVTGNIEKFIASHVKKR